MRLFLRSLSLSLIISCSENHKCNIDNEFQEKYQNSIHIAKRVSQGENIPYEIRAAAFETLRVITGVNSSETTGDSPFLYLYSDSIDYFKRDLEKWNSWYEHHKCDFKLEYADSLLKVADTKWPQLLSREDIEQ